jgi:hypothetical protein
MKALFAMLWSVCTMRRGPDELPHSLALLGLVLGLNMALGIGIQWLSAPLAPDAAVGLVLLTLALDALVLWALLAFKRLELRYMQTLTTIYGVDFLLGLVALPLIVAGVLLGKGPWMAVFVFLQMLLVGWNLGVRGFVYHRALEIGIFQANMLSLTMFLLHIFLAAKLFPELLARTPAQ